MISFPAKISLRFGLLLVLTGVCFFGFSGNAKADIATEGATCVSNAQAQNIVTGYSYFVPGTLTIGTNEVKSITLRTFVCNGTPWNVEDDQTIFGNSVVQETGRNGAIDFSVSLPNFFGDPNYWVQGMGGVQKGQFIYKDITVNIKGSAFDGDGTYHIGVQGFGVVKYVSPQNGFNVGCGPSFGQCVTNVATTYLTLNIKRPAVDYSFTAKPVVQLPSLSPDNESPNTASFTSGVTLSVGSSGPSKVKGGKVTRRYEIRKLSGAIIAIPSPGDDNRDLSTFTYPAQTRSGLSLQTGDKVCQIVTVSPAQGTVDSTGAVLTGGTTSSTDEKCAAVVNKPYVRFYGNDVFAGGAFTGGNCSNASQILTYYSNSQKKGSGVQLAAIALGTISQFSSAAQSGNQPTGLTFANTTGGYGGQFGGTHCIPDYWANRPTAVANAGSINVTTLADGNYSYKPPSGTFVIDGSTVVNRVGLFVDGDVVIKGDVRYASGPWATTDDIPALRLVVRGNIFIASNVQSLEGIFIAQPKDPNVSSFGNGGRLYTCTKPDGSLFTAAELSANCSVRLTVTGAVIAQQTKLLRTINSLRDGNNSEPASSSRAAEIFQFSPEAYIAPPTDKDLNQNGTSLKYDYYTALPPVL